MSTHHGFRRRATDLLELDSRAWRSMPALTPSGVMGGCEVSGRHLARIAELEKSVAQLERNNRDLAAFAADVAHDLRSPLQAVTGFAELLTHREGPRLDETSQGFMGHILGAACAMRDLVEAVLEQRQSTCGALAPTWVDTHDLVLGVVRSLRHDLDGAGVEVEVAELPRVFADRVQLGRVFQNLLSNALEARHPDRLPKIAVTARRLSTAWEFAVTDSGVGVLPQDCRRIFELFQRGTRDGERGSGHGMGLAICRAVVERHGGHIGVENTSGGGARFSFTIPNSNGGP